MRPLARLAAALWLAVAPAAGLAQEVAEEDRDPGFLAGLIEDNLSTVSRQVTVRGFEGALSSEATVEELTIADGEGVWLRATGLVLDWNRTALLRGRIEVEELSAESLTILRPPVPDPDLPAPEASPFSLPELPVSVEVGDFRIEELTLGEPILGEEIVLAVEGAAALADGEGTVTLAAERIDAPGTYSVEGSYSNESRILDLALQIAEPQGGLVARTLGLPGDPALQLTVAGEGSIDDYAADISLSTEGEQRVTGQFQILRVGGEAGGAEGAPPTTRIALDLSGNLAPLLPETYRPFVGDAAELSLEAARTAGGATVIPQLRLRTDALAIEGEAEIGPDNWPVRLQLDGTLGTTEDGPVAVPGGTDVGSATISLDYDAAESDDFTFVAEASDIDRGDTAVGRLNLTAVGSLEPPEAGEPGSLDVEVDFAAEGLELANAALAEALGPEVRGHVTLVRDGGPVQLSDLSLTGPGLEVSGSGEIQGTEDSFLSSFDLELAADDLARFAELAGTELSGAATLDVTLQTRPLDGAFEIALDGQTQDLGIGNPALDALLAGTGTLDLAAERDEAGTRLEQLVIETPALSAEASATLTSGASQATFDLAVPDVSVAIPGLTGSAELTGTAGIGTDGSGRLVVSGSVPDGQIDIEADLAATEAGGGVSFDAIAAIADLSPYSTLAGRELSGGIELAAEGTAARDASTFDTSFTLRGSDLAIDLDRVDPLLAGDVRASGRAVRTGPEAFRIEDLALASPIVSARGSASYDAGLVQTDGLTADVADLAPFSALAGRELSGAVSADVAGQLATDLSTFDLTLDAEAEDLALGLPDIDPLLDGAVTLEGHVVRSGPLDFVIEDLDLSSPLATATGDATIEDGVVTTPGLSVGVADLAPFSDLAGRPLDGQVAADVTGTAALDASTFDLTVDAEATDLALGLPDIDPLLAGTVTVQGDVQRTGPESFAVQALDLASPLVSASGSATLEDGVVTTEGLDLSVADLAPFSDLAGRPLDGSVALEAEGAAALDAATFDLTLQARTEDLEVGIDAVDRLLAGPGRLNGRIARTGPLDFTAEDVSASTPAFGLTLDGAIEDGLGSGTFDARIADASILAPGLSGGASLAGTIERTGTGALDLEVTGSGPGGLSLSADATLEPVDPETPALWDIAGEAAFSVDSLGTWSGLVGRSLGGSLEATLDGQLRTDLSTADVTFDASASNLDVGIPAVAELLSGTGTASGRLVAGPEGVRVDDLDVDFPNLSADADVTTDAEGRTAIAFDLRLADLGLFVPDFPGPVTATGTATSLPDGGYLIDASATGPGGVTADVAGTYQADGTLDLDASGTVPLGLANPFLEPRRIEGLAQFDLSIEGPPALSSVSGQVTVNDARLALPTFGEALTGIDATISLSGGQATIDLGGALPDGGTVSVSGPVGLSPPFDANLTIDLANLVIRDPALYQAEVGGQITITGPLTGGATIGGVVRIDRAEIRVPSGSLGSLGDLPLVEHVNPPQDVRTTLDRAGLTVSGVPIDDADGDGVAGGGPSYQLDLTILAPGQIFVRGRGLDAELGGSLTIAGTTQEPIPAGQFELIRGRLDILQQRFDLDEGRITLLGDFSPYLRLVAVTEAPDGTEVEIILDGELQDLQVTFDSSPQLPQDEVLARLLFGRDIQSISPLQAVQLASAIATLAGGGPGLLEQFRTGLGLDDFDLTTTEGGGTAVRLGRYLSENVYTDVTVGTEGTQASINLDLTADLTVRGAVSDEGETSLGIFFERDY